MSRAALDTRQLDLFAAPDRPANPAIEAIDLAAQREARLRAWEPANMVDRDQYGRPRVQTRAATHGGLITLYHPDAREPYELEVRGMACVVANGSTHVIGEVGGLFWSETGFRSFLMNDAGPDEMREVIESHIDAKRDRNGGGGLGGKLLRWWPHYVLQWRESLRFELEYCKDRSTVWDQWGPEKWAEHWAAHDAKLADALAQMARDGIDPNEVGPPDRFKGKWPTFNQAALL